MKQVLSILPELLILSGGVILFFAIIGTTRILKLAEVPKYSRYWKILISLMIFFLLGYLATACLIYFGLENYLTSIISLVFFFGALFVYLIVYKGGLTLSNIRKTQNELEERNFSNATDLRKELAERSKTEERLKASEENFRIMAESSPLHILRIDKDAKIQYINWAVPSLTTKDAIGLSVYNHIHPASKNIYEKNIASVFRDGRVARFEVQERKTDKEMRWYFSIIAPIKGKQEINSAIILTSDITEQKKTEVKLAEALSILQATFDSAVEGILAVDMNGKIITFNKQFTELWKIPNEFLEAKDDKKALDFALSQLKEPDKFMNKVQELYSLPEAKSFDVLEFIDGRIFERYSTPERRNGEIVGRVWNFIDVTARKKVEEILKLSQEKYRQLVEGAADVVYSTDGKGYFTYINPVGKKLTGYDEKELLGKHYSELVAPDWKKQVIEFYKDQLKNKIQETVFSFPILTKSGAEKWVEQKVNQLRQGELVTGHQAICRDITDRKRMEEELEEEIKRGREYEKQLELKTKELQSSNQDLENFAYIASHDLQEPLRMVISFLQLLEQNLEGKLEKDSKEFLDFASDGAKRMRDMINDLLSYSRIMTRKAEFKKVDMNQVLKDALLHLKEKIDESHAEITAENLPEIMADNIKMTRLFQNLISNAIKFSQPDKKPIVKIGCKEGDDSWLFSVADNGIGIKKEYFEKIFVIFQRLHTRIEYPGTGIGLAECKKIVELHKGTIWVEAEEGKGSTFYFTIKKNIAIA